MSIVPPYCGHTAVDCACQQAVRSVPILPIHEHRFVFLRTYEDRGTYAIERGDVFFCEGCLEYRRVPT